MGRLCTKLQARKAGAWRVRRAEALLGPTAQPPALWGWPDPAGPTLSGTFSGTNYDGTPTFLMTPTP